MTSLTGPRPNNGGIRLSTALAAARWVGLAAILAIAAASPGFTSMVSLLSLASEISWVGLVAVGMSFITISGNIMSFCMAATMATSSVVFIATLGWGVWPAFAATILFGIVVQGVQGAIIGWFRANPIIVSMAGLALLVGGANVATGGTGVFAEGEAYRILKGKIGPLPIEFVFFVILALAGQALLAFTRFGREVYMVGSNLRAAEAAGIRTARVTALCYAFAGVAAAAAGILIAARYGESHLDLDIGYDYQAIAGILVGGIAIEGGSGSVARACAGVVVIALISSLLIFHGFSTALQALVVGVAVLGVVMLQGLARGR